MNRRIATYCRRWMRHKNSYWYDVIIRDGIVRDLNRCASRRQAYTVIGPAGLASRVWISKQTRCTKPHFDAGIELRPDLHKDTGACLHIVERDVPEKTEFKEGSIGQINGLNLITRELPKTTTLRQLMRLFKK